MNGWNILVTGASRGLGLALSRELARRGARVVGVARGEEIEVAMAGIRAEGGAAWAIRADVGAPDAAARIAGAAAALVGPIDGLVQNAGTLGAVPLRPWLDGPADALEEALRVNTLGPAMLLRAVAGGMALRGRGVIVTISSDAAVEAYPTWGPYGASKAANDQLHRVVAAELAGTGVAVHVVDPGEMDTRMHADAVPDADRTSLGRPEAAARRIADLFETDASARVAS